MEGPATSRTPRVVIGRRGGEPPDTTHFPELQRRFEEGRAMSAAGAALRNATERLAEAKEKAEEKAHEADAARSASADKERTARWKKMMSSHDRAAFDQAVKLLSEAGLPDAVLWKARAHATDPALQGGSMQVTSLIEILSTVTIIVERLPALLKDPAMGDQQRKAATESRIKTLGELLGDPSTTAEDLRNMWRAIQDTARP